MQIQLLIFVLLSVNFAQSMKVDIKSKTSKSAGKRSRTTADKKSKKANLVKNEAEPQAGVSDRGGDSREKREWLQMCLYLYLYLYL